MDPLADGLSDTVRTIRLERTLAVLRDRFGSDGAPAEPVDPPEVIARHVAAAVRRRIETESDDERRIALANRLLAVLESDEGMPGSLHRLIASSGLTAAHAPRQRPPSALTDAAEPTSLATELHTELATADRVDLRCGFVRRDGLLLLDGALSELRRRGVPFRVITTAQPGATERDAVDRLVRWFNATVRIGYDPRAARSHANAWLFHRVSGDDTAFVGGANLSRASLTDGMDWTSRLSGVATPELLRKFAATFDEQWGSAAFAPYDPAADAARLDAALAGGSDGAAAVGTTGLDVRPLPHQQEALTALDTARGDGRRRNLVVAPTGTGKTVLAALDYRRLRERRDLGLLYVAPRDDVVERALRTFRETLGDDGFGTGFVDGKPPRRRHLFAGIAALEAHGIEQLPAERFDVVVVDEPQPATARLLAHLRPKQVLGLSATSDLGAELREHFDGRAAHELPLCDALAAELLAPVHYYGIADDVDLSDAARKYGGYDPDDLDRRYTGNDARADAVIAALREHVPDVAGMRAVGWCVSAAHAEHMTRVACESGIPAATGAEALRTGEVRLLFTADEDALDVPEIDTVLLLWPADDPARFLRQLGAGLPRVPGKSALTVLDFIGGQRPEFRFDLRYRALTGASRRGLRRQVEQGFPGLPSGSRAVLDPAARRIVLGNLSARPRLSREQLAADVASHGDLPLAAYLHEADRTLSDVYRNGGGWTLARRAAGFATPSGGPAEDALLRRVAAFAHVDDAERAEVYRRLVDVDGPGYGELSEREQRLARMLLFTVWPKRGGMASYPAGLARLRRHPAVCAEIAEVIDVRLDAARHVATPLDAALSHVPLASHASYLREEVLAGLGYTTLRRVPGNHTAAAAWCPATNTDVVLIGDGAGEPLGSERFRWRPKHALSASSPAGRRYRQHRERGSEVVLFLRREPAAEGGPPTFRCLGNATYAGHEEDPLAITWRLHRPMPAELVTSADGS